MKIVAREEADILFSASLACVNVKMFQIVNGGVDVVDGGGYRGAMEHV